jgi:hypothetical protein
VRSGPCFLEPVPEICTDLFGEPVVTADGKMYRRLSTKPELAAAWLISFCDTDWSAEREAVAAAQSARGPGHRMSD